MLGTTRQENHAIKRLVCTFTVLLCLPAAAFGAQKHHPSLAGREWAACSQTDVVPCIEYAAWKYHQPVAVAKLVAYRESTDEPTARNGECLGLFQILYPSTWDGNTINGRYVPNPYRGRSPFSARYSALTAMRMWSYGMQGQWTTYP